MNLKLTPEAVADLREAAEWLGERSPSLPSRFGEVFNETLKLIDERPEMYPVVHHRFRRALIKTFPWAVFYTIEGKTIVVHAIVHQARHPRI